MQNKPNFWKSQMNVTSLITVDYENIANWTLGENKPNPPATVFTPKTNIPLKKTSKNPNFPKNPEVNQTDVLQAAF